MKRVLFLAIVWIALCYTTKAQEENVFPTDNAIWNILIDGVEHYYGLTGDTIINDTLYNKLYLLNDTTLIIDHNDIYVGGFRQEGKKVWFRPSFPPFYLYNYEDPYHEETLLYDFSKSAGDTVFHNFILDPFSLYGMQASDSISMSIIVLESIDEKGRKMFYTEVFDSRQISFLIQEDIWTEGIGSIRSGLFWFFNKKNMIGLPEFYLACLKKDNEYIFTNHPRPSCHCFCSGVGIFNKKCSMVDVIYENSYIQITGTPVAFSCDFKLYTITGNLIFEKKFQSNKETFFFNKKGLYIYQIISRKQILKTDKLIIK